MSEIQTGVPQGTDIRERAVKQLKKKRDFYGHLLAYISVNTMLVVIWSMTSHGFFWPVFPLLGWGIGVVMNAWDVFRGDFTEDQIEHEVARLQRHR